MITITVNGVDYDVPSSAADTNWAASQVAFEQALATAVNAPTWHAIGDVALQNGWANNSAGALKYCKDSFGFVHLRGLLHSGSSGTVAYTMVVGFRPAFAETFTVAASGGAASVLVDTDGTLTISNLTSGASVNTNVSLSGIVFSVNS